MLKHGRVVWRGYVAQPKPPLATGRSAIDGAAAGDTNTRQCVVPTYTHEASRTSAATMTGQQRHRDQATGLCVRAGYPHLAQPEGADTPVPVPVPVPDLSGIGDSPPSPSPI
jgi:hypothetical protein